MIVAVKRKDYKRFIVKLVSFGLLLLMFIGYYFHMSETFSNYGQAQTPLNQDTQIRNQSKQIEDIIYHEAKTVVDLIGQIHVDRIKILNQKLFLVCDPETNLESLVVRYGVMALIKRSVQDIKIAIDLKTIVESRVES